MHVPVKLASREENAQCSACQEYNICIVFQVHVGLAVDDTEPVCKGCLAAGTELMALVEQPDMRPGPQPPSRRLKRRSVRQERGIADETGGKRQAASGALPGLKGDAHKKGVYRVEAKLSLSRQFTMTLEVLDKIRSEASYGEVPSLVVTFVDKNTYKEHDCWVAIPMSDWKEKIGDASATHNR